MSIIQEFPLLYIYLNIIYLLENLEDQIQCALYFIYLFILNFRMFNTRQGTSNNIRHIHQYEHKINKNKHEEKTKNTRTRLEIVTNLSHMFLKLNLCDLKIYLGAFVQMIVVV